MIETEKKLVELQGSPKQITRAEKIRSQILDSIARLAEYNPDLTEIPDCTDFLASTLTSAKWWIEHRDIPAFAFVAYFYRKADKLVDNRMPVYYARQAIKENGIEQKSQLVPMRFVFFGQNGTNPKQIVKEMPNIELWEAWKEGEQAKVKLHRNTDGAKTRIILSSSDESEDGCDTIITPVRDLLDAGWGSRDIEIVVVSAFLERERIGGSNKAYAFEKVG